MHSDIQELIEILPEIKAAYKSGGRTYGQIAEKYSKLAHRVFMNLMENNKGLFNDNYQPIMLDVFVVGGRVESLLKAGEEDMTPMNPEFWNHGDAIKTLAEYLLMVKQDEKMQCTPCT